MKRIFIISCLIFLLIIISTITVLTLVGYETDKFNEVISKKIIKNNQKISLNLEKIKFKFDIKDLSLFLETNSPELKYQNIKIPVENIKVYLDLVSLIKSKAKINKINVISKEIDINQLKNIVIKTKPSNLNSFITNKISDGVLIANFEFYINADQKIDNFIARGDVARMDAIINNDLKLKNTNFNFFADSTDILIKNISSETEGFKIKSGNLKINKNQGANLEFDFNTDINIDKKNISKYLPFSKDINLINRDTNFNANLNHFLKISFDKTFKINEFTYTNKGKIKELFVKLDKSIKSSFLENDIDFLFFKDSDLSIRYSSDKKNYINTKGSYSVDNKDYNNYNFENNFLSKTSDINLNFEFLKKLNIDFLNYKKDKNKLANISLNLNIDKDLINIKELIYKENKSLIKIEKLKINKRNIISLQKIKVKTYNGNNLKNDFNLNFGKDIRIIGLKYDANNLNKLLNQKKDNNILKNINKNIDIDLKSINTPLSKKLTNFKLIGVIEKGKFKKILAKGDFGNNKFLDISMKSNKKNKKKYLEIYSDLPQPLLSDYSFFKGLSGGILSFTSIIDKDSSTSKLTIDNFKVVNAPGVIKILSLADFGGLVDLAQGDGLSFEKMEINMSNNKGFLKLDEIYAVGPSISVLMEGYKENTGLTSLRGTLVPAKNLNRFLSKIPVIGKIIIPDQIGEGLFGVSFKMKGMPGKIKTTINPIKTITPRFITKALEKVKQSK
ncbi:MAG: hypothetical protein ACJZ8J_02685 [Candidatus Pelagibacter sp.]